MRFFDVCIRELDTQTKKETGKVFNKVVKGNDLTTADTVKMVCITKFKQFNLFTLEVREVF